MKKAFIQGLTQYEIDDIIKECEGNLRCIIKKINLRLLALKKNFDFRTEDEDAKYNENSTPFKP